MKQRNPMILVPLFALAAAAVYLALVRPCLDQIGRDRTVQDDLRAKSRNRMLELRSGAGIQKRISDTDAEIKRLEEFQLAPLLGSYAMRAKSIVEDFAVEAGLVDAEFSDRSMLALPVLPGKPVPEKLHARRPVAIACRGDYPAIVSFILRVERELPHVAVGALRITPDLQNPDLQRAEIVLEWPAKGAEKK